LSTISSAGEDPPKRERETKGQEPWRPLAAKGRSDQAADDSLDFSLKGSDRSRRKGALCGMGESGLGVTSGILDAAGLIVTRNGAVYIDRSLPG